MYFYSVGVLMVQDKWNKTNKCVALETITKLVNNTPSIKTTFQTWKRKVLMPDMFSIQITKSLVKSLLSLNPYPANTESD